MDVNPGLFSGITALLGAELDQESAAGFPKLKRIPSTGIIRFLDYWESLPAGEHDPLIEALASLGTLHFFPGPLIAKTHDELRTTNPACLRMSAAMTSPQFAYGLRYEGLRMARAVLNDPQSVEMMKKTPVSILSRATIVRASLSARQIFCRFRRRRRRCCGNC